LCARITCGGVNKRRPRSRRRRYVVSRGCSESQREMVEGATRWPCRDEMRAPVSSSVAPRSYVVSASRISLTGYVLLRTARGPGEKVRPHERQRRRGRDSSFLLRVPFLMRRVLLQWGQRSGRLIGDDVVVPDRGSIRAGAYHSVRARSRICKMGRSGRVRAPDLQIGATDLQTVGGRLEAGGRRQIRKKEPVARRRVGP
jgi:hypothetical protein